MAGIDFSILGLSPIDKGLTPKNAPGDKLFERQMAAEGLNVQRENVRGNLALRAQEGQEAERSNMVKEDQGQQKIELDKEELDRKKVKDSESIRQFGVMDENAKRQLGMQERTTSLGEKRFEFDKDVGYKRLAHDIASSDRQFELDVEELGLKKALNKRQDERHLWDKNDKEQAAQVSQMIAKAYKEGGVTAAAEAMISTGDLVGGATVMNAAAKHDSDMETAGLNRGVIKDQKAADKWAKGVKLATDSVEAISQRKDPAEQELLTETTFAAFNRATGNDYDASDMTSNEKMNVMKIYSITGQTTMSQFAEATGSGNANKGLGDFFTNSMVNDSKGPDIDVNKAALTANNVSKGLRETFGNEVENILSPDANTETKITSLIDMSLKAGIPLPDNLMDMLDTIPVGEEMTAVQAQQVKQAGLHIFDNAKKAMSISQARKAAVSPTEEPEVSTELDAKPALRAAKEEVAKANQPGAEPQGPRTIEDTNKAMKELNLLSTNDEGIEIGTKLRNDIQVEFKAQKDMLDTLTNIQQNVDPDLLKTGSKLMNIYGGVKDKLVNASEKEKSKLVKQLALEQPVQEFFALWAKSISGGAIAASEFERLKKATLNFDLSPEQFVASMEKLIQRTRTRSDENYKILKSGKMVKWVPPSEREGAALAESIMKEVISDTNKAKQLEINAAVKRLTGGR